MADEHAPQLIFEGGSDTLQLEDGGKVYRPGDVIPRLSQARRIVLQSHGIRFVTRHYEPPVTPDGAPAEMAAARQIPEGAVVAEVVDMPQAAPLVVADEKAAQDTRTPSRRASAQKE